MNGTDYMWRIELKPDGAYKYEINVWYRGDLIGETFTDMASTMFTSRYIIRRTIRRHRQTLKRSTWTGEV